MQPNLSPCGSSSKTDSTEDLWSEDQYLPDPYLPSPDYLVSVAAVQPPSLESNEEKPVVLDETWDYNYEEEEKKKAALFPFERHYHSLNDSLVASSKRFSPSLPSFLFSLFLSLSLNSFFSFSLSLLSLSLDSHCQDL